MNCSPSGLVKNGVSVAPSTGRSNPRSMPDRSWCTRSLTEVMTAAIATSTYCPSPVALRWASAARTAIAACRPE